MNTLYTKKKDLFGKEIRVIIWDLNEYDGSIQCNAESFKSFEEDPDFYFRNGCIHYILRKPCVSWRSLNIMMFHYVSHTPKKWSNKPDWAGSFPNGRKGLPYAEIKVY